MGNARVRRISGDQETVLGNRTTKSKDHSLTDPGLLNRDIFYRIKITAALRQLFKWAFHSGGGV